MRVYMRFFAYFFTFLKRSIQYLVFNSLEEWKAEQRNEINKKKQMKTT